MAQTAKNTWQVITFTNSKRKLYSVQDISLTHLHFRRVEFEMVDAARGRVYQSPFEARDDRFIRHVDVDYSL